MPQWMQDLFAATNGTNATPIRLQNLADFDAFILDNIPYGQVDPKSFQWGLIQYDGPDSSDLAKNAKPMLQWHFRGVPYPITRAVRLEYSYERKWDGSDTLVSASLLFGFQKGLSDFELTPAPRGKLAGLQLAAFQALEAQPAKTAQERLHAMRTAVFAEPTVLITGLPSVQKLQEPTLRKFIENELDHEGTITYQELQKKLVSVQFDGPAQNADSHRAFPYTLQTLWNDQDKYNQLLWWYFGGTATRVTKAMRIQFDEADENSHSMLIGFTGPGTTPV